MVAGAPERLRKDAVAFFRVEDLPDSLGWVDALTSLQLRQFAVELADALKDCLLRDDDGALKLLLDDWEATAEVTSSPEIVAELRRRKNYQPLATFSE
ncbi:MAG: hypothetical protein OXC94_05670 [Chloroflexi bacterium]|nr:hypothetical protein [Chloroflexota bacterium]